MDKFFVGIEHHICAGLTVAYLIDEIKPSIVCIEARSLEEAKKRYDTAPIYEKCCLENIPVISLDWKFTRLEELKGTVFTLVCACTNMWFDLLGAIFSWSALKTWHKKQNVFPCLPFVSFVDGEREKEWIKKMDEAGVGEGVMMVVVGLAHIDSLKKHYKK